MADVTGETSVPSRIRSVVTAKAAKVAIASSDDRSRLPTTER